GPAAIDDQVDQVGAARLDEDLLELEPVEHQRGRRGRVAIDDRGELALAVKPARALAEEIAGGCVELHEYASGWGRRAYDIATYAKPSSGRLPPGAHAAVPGSAPAADHLRRLLDPVHCPL